MDSDGRTSDSVAPASAMVRRRRDAKDRPSVSDELSGDDEITRYGDGDLIGERYRLARLLGRGGMGQVWLAHNQVLDVDVALKLISPRRRAKDQAERLLREAQAAARLDHPSIVRVFDFGLTHWGDPYIVMELLSGEDLATALRTRGRQSATKAVRTLLPILHALSTAHAKGIVHRDLKPENIFLQWTEEHTVQPKVVDFGIAKLERATQLRLTQTGAVLGSPLYMSPEQARGDEVDHRGDVWAIGVVLYEMICGRPPFEGKNYNAILYSIIANPPLPSTELGAGDESLWQTLQWTFNKDPDARPQTARELGVALARWLQGRGVHDDITGASIDRTWLGQPATAEEAPDFAAEVPPESVGTRRSDIETRIVMRSQVPPPRRRAMGWRVGAVAALLVAAGLGAWAAGAVRGPSASGRGSAMPAPQEPRGPSSVRRIDGARSPETQQSEPGSPVDHASEPTEEPALDEASATEKRTPYPSRATGQGTPRLHNGSPSASPVADRNPSRGSTSAADSTPSAARSKRAPAPPTRSRPSMPPASEKKPALMNPF